MTPSEDLGAVTVAKYDQPPTKTALFRPFVSGAPPGKALAATPPAGPLADRKSVV